MYRYNSVSATSAHNTILTILILFLSFYTVGVIVKVDRDTFRVLDQNGEVRTIQPHQITNKRDSKRAVATDANGNSIQSGDTVIEKDGERRSGNILHLYRQLVFLHSREYLQNFGVWVTRTRSVASVAAKGGRAVSSVRETNIKVYCCYPNPFIFFTRLIQRLIQPSSSHMAMVTLEVASVTEVEAVVVLVAVEAELVEVSLVMVVVVETI